MKALIVFAHPRVDSFTHALVNTVTKELIDLDYSVTIRDLYKMKFNPVLEAEDMIHIVDGEFTRDNYDFPEEIQIEQEYILDSDLLIYIFPIWWNGMPAIMKGYVDRVFQHGFAYSFNDDLPKKHFAGKKALFLTPTGQPQNEDGSDTPLNLGIKTVTSDWMFASNGVDVIDHVFFGKVPYLSRDELALYLDETVQILRNI